MFAYDKTFGPKVVLGQYDLISRFSDFPLYLGTKMVYFFHNMYEYDKTFDRKVFLGHLTLFHGSVILPYISTLSWYFFHTSF